MRKRNDVALNVLALGLAGLFAVVPARAESVWGLEWTLNEDATTDGSSIVLTPDETDKVGTAWASEQRDIVDSPALSAYFEFRISGSEDNWDPGDGMAFVIHNGSDTDYGTGGGNLGYGGLGAKLIAVEFDTWACTSCSPAETAAPHVAIHLSDNNPPGGTEASIASSPFVLARHEGDSNLFAWIDFDPNSHNLSVFLNDDSVKPGTPLLLYNLGNTLSEYFDDGQWVTYGFTAGTGAAHSQHEVIDFSMTPVPLPAAAWLLLSGLGGFAALGRRKAAS